MKNENIQTGEIDSFLLISYIRLQIFNDKLIEFERLFIIDDQLHRTNTADETHK
jgi:hypothetical protein